MIKSVIVDDETIARDLIKKFLENEKDISVIGECDNGEDAVKLILEKKPELVFLDIQMAEMNGFDVIDTVGPENMPYVIFITAYDKYALKAFEINALDYLLKPFDNERFQISLKRAKSLIYSDSTLSSKIHSLLSGLKSKESFIKRILIKERGRIFFIKTEEIRWIEAAEYYLKIHTDKEDHLIREGINNIEEKLDPSEFIRIHRSFIVKIDQIKEFQLWRKNQYAAILKDGTRLNVSRSYHAKVIDGNNLR